MVLVLLVFFLAIQLLLSFVGDPVIIPQPFTPGRAIENAV